MALTNILDKQGAIIEQFLNNGISSLKIFSQYKTEFIASITAMILLLYILNLIRKRNYSVVLFKVNVILFVVLSVVEILYILSNGSNSVWFCKPSITGWLWTIINFFIYFFVVFIQYLDFKKLLREYSEDTSANYRFKIGIFSWGIAILALHYSLRFYITAVPIVLLLLVLFQITQITIIIVKALPNGGILKALEISGFYILGSLSTVLILFHFIPLLIIALLVFIAMLFLPTYKSDSRKIKYCEGCGARLFVVGSDKAYCPRNPYGERKYGSFPYCEYCGLLKTKCTCK